VAPKHQLQIHTKESSQLTREEGATPGFLLHARKETKGQGAPFTNPESGLEAQVPKIHIRKNLLIDIYHELLEPDVQALNGVYVLQEQ
jgi:hypothetical protein